MGILWVVGMLGTQQLGTVEPEGILHTVRMGCNLKDKQVKLVMLSNNKTKYSIFERDGM